MNCKLLRGFSRINEAEQLSGCNMRQRERAREREREGDRGDREGESQGGREREREEGRDGGRGNERAERKGGKNRHTKMVDRQRGQKQKDRECASAKNENHLRILIANSGFGNKTFNRLSLQTISISLTAYVVKI